VNVNPLEQSPQKPAEGRKSDGHGTKPAAVRERAILALLSAKGIGEAAEQSGVNEKTLRRWMAQDAFKTNDPRLLAIARQFLGRSAVPYRATLFDKTSARNWLVTWHQDVALPLQERRDVPGWSAWSMKSGITYAHAPPTALSHVVALRLHLDDSREDNGPLRVLPGTHALGVPSEADTERLVREIPPVDCLVLSGGIIAMRPLILHASSKSETNQPRRVLHIEYADSLEVGDGLRIAIA
jgi:ectoine hydroxylase-related dioxygenase (phytanoyl-CoA dioxygenase family)